MMPTLVGNFEVSLDAVRKTKVPFVAAIQLSEAERPQVVRFDRVDGFKQEDIANWTSRYIASGSHIVSDGLNCFTVFAGTGMAHQREVVGTDRRCTDMPCFMWINTVLGNLKTALAGTYHAFRYRKYARRYLAEYQYRFNRRFDLKAIVPRLLRAAATTAPRSEAWLSPSLTPPFAIPL